MRHATLQHLHAIRHLTPADLGALKSVKAGRRLEPAVHADLERRGFIARGLGGTGLTDAARAAFWVLGS